MITPISECSDDENIRNAMFDFVERRNCWLVASNCIDSTIYLLSCYVLVMISALNDRGILFRIGVLLHWRRPENRWT